MSLNYEPAHLKQAENKLTELFDKQDVYKRQLYTFKRMCHDLITCQQELEKVTGQPVQWFRPPFGVTNPTPVSYTHLCPFLQALTPYG